MNRYWLVILLLLFPLAQSAPLIRSDNKKSRFNPFLPVRSLTNPCRKAKHSGSHDRISFPTGLSRPSGVSNCDCSSQRDDTKDGNLLRSLPAGT